MANPEEVLAQVRGFMASRVLLTAAELDLFTRLHRGVATAEDLARQLETDLRATTRLLDVLRSFGLLEEVDACYGVTEKGALFSSEHSTSVLPMVLHMNHLWGAWGELTEIVRKGSRPGAKGPQDSSGEEVQRAFIQAMHVVGKDLAHHIAGDIDLARSKRLLDIGGGSGTYTVAFLKENPSMEAILFDLPGVIPLARERFASEGLESRASAVPGDFYRDDLPGGCDLALLSAIIHQNSPEQNLVPIRERERTGLDTGSPRPTDGEFTLVEFYTFFEVFQFGLRDMSVQPVINT